MKLKINRIAYVILGAAMCLGCEKKLEPYFTAAESETYLTESDKRTVGECVKWIKKYEEIKDKEDEASQEMCGECVEKALEPIKKLYAESRKDDSLKGRRRSGALAWVMVDFSYNNFNGTCAIWIMYASELGLIDAIQIRQDPPNEDLASYLLPPAEQKKWREAHKNKKEPEKEEK